MSTLAELFGKRLCFARLALGWTQADLARESGIARSQIAAYESGAHRPGLFNAAAIARALGMTLDDLTAPDGGTR
jgi:transcriptional regulator with XRE-family HTH domain